MPKKSVREILENLESGYYAHRYGDKNKIDQALQSLSDLVLAELEALKKDRFLKTDRPEYQLGWVDGHKKAVDEAKEVIAKLIREG